MSEGLRNAGQLTTNPEHRLLVGLKLGEVANWGYSTGFLPFTDS
jgi:hypothetical protein